MHEPVAYVCSARALAGLFTVLTAFRLILNSTAHFFLLQISVSIRREKKMHCEINSLRAMLAIPSISRA
jgi:hypothetical protein